MEINEKLSMYQAVKEAAKRNGNCTAVFYQGRKINYKQWYLYKNS